MRRWTVVVAFLFVGGCADDRLFGLKSGPLPEPQDFVVQSRPAGDQTFPAVGVTPSKRAQKPMTKQEAETLDESLRRAAGVP